MPTVAQRSFASGEITPSLYARVDFSRYAVGLRTCRNFLVMRHGGGANRPGTQFISNGRESLNAGIAWNGNTALRLIPFIFSNNQAYVLEFSPGRMRVIRDGAYIVDESYTITGITNAAEAVVSYSGSDPTAFNKALFISGVEGMPEINNRYFMIRDIDSGANTFKLTEFEPDMGSGTYLDTTSYGTYDSGGTAQRIFELNAPYTEDKLPKLNYAQSADVLNIVVEGTNARELRRLSETSWTLTNASFAPAQAAPTGALAGGSPGFAAVSYKITAVNDETGEESLADQAITLADPPSVADPVTVTWNATAGASKYYVYKAQGYGTWVQTSRHGYIDLIEGLTLVDTGQYTPDTAFVPPVARNPVSDYGFPTTVAYFQQRKVYGGFANAPERIEASQIGNYTNYGISTPLQEDDAVAFTMAGRTVNAVRHMIDLNSLVIFTESGEHEARGNDAGILTPTGINLRQHSYNGSGTLSPLIINNNALYLQARGSIVRDLGYDFQADGYKGNDLTIASSHLVDGFTITDWAYAQTPNSIVWAVRNDGVLLGLTYIREQEMLAWHRHDTDGDVLNVCVIPEGDEDAVYIVVRRTIDGLERNFVERFYSRRIDDVEDSVFSDSAQSYDGTNYGSTAMNVQLDLGSPDISNELTTSSKGLDLSNSDKMTAQTFTPGSAIKVKAIGIILDAQVGATGEVVVDVVPTFGNGDPDESTVLSRSNVFDVSTIATGVDTEITFFFDDPAELSASVTYAFIVRTVTVGSTVMRISDNSGTGAYAGGNVEVSNFGGAAWFSDVDNDLWFKIYGTDGAPDPWSYESTLKLTSDSSFFKTSSVGNDIVLKQIVDGEVIDSVALNITQYNSATEVLAKPSKTVPEYFRDLYGAGVPEFTDWSYAVDQIYGLWHLEGKTVAVVGDGHVLGSPYNDEYTEITVQNGSISLENRYSKIHVGLPYICDIETLDIDVPEGDALLDKSKMIGAVTVYMEKSRGGYLGIKPPSDDAVDPKEYLEEIKFRDAENMEDPVALKTEALEVVIRGQWNTNGRVFLRQLEPLPMSVLSIAPAGKIAGGGR